MEMSVFHITVFIHTDRDLAVPLDLGYRPNLYRAFHFSSRCG